MWDIIASFAEENAPMKNLVARVIRNTYVRTALTRDLQPRESD